ncbi:ABC transporter ATP-binding protein [Staphylothermus hellenicus]|uniref:ABC transporter related protein n=1 Tax=Staphylothermus hellenicus (strain DSM 12710 / JCM 10830 / BK20S6-10-b1 / P8) TaxID=591019 RepID=D7DBY2_STAHD|nr:ABC transporter ATP-binding protein [Staphylothermus hellenicus]ADI31679.1 ABC transporter related protein [Staphylothermus hellenicus DSM 12710]
MDIDRIVLKNVVKKYKRFTLKIKHAEFRKGLNLVVGSNGSGKTTMLKMIAGFTWPSNGNIEIIAEGKKYSPRQAMKLVGYVAEDVIFPNLKVRELIESFSSGSTCEELISNLDLRDHLDKKYLELSAGLRKRVQIAIALLKKPKIILLDEPFSNLDIFIIPRIKDILEKLGEKTIIIVTSHIGIEADVETITILDQGRLLYHGDPSVIKQRIVFEADVEGKTVSMDLDALNKIIHPIKIRSVKINSQTDAIVDFIKSIKNNKIIHS